MLSALLPMLIRKVSFKITWTMVVFFFVVLAGCSHLLIRTAAPSPCSPTKDGCVCIDKIIPYPECSSYLSYPPEQINPFLERYSK